MYNAGDKADVLIAMNPAALKVNAHHLKKGAIVIFDTDSFLKKDLDKAVFTTDDPFKELNIEYVQQVPVAITSMTKNALANSGLDNKDILRSKNMFALGIVCWLYNRPIDIAEQLLKDKFRKKPTVADMNINVLIDGYNYGNNTHLTASTYRIDSVLGSKEY